MRFKLIVAFVEDDKTDAVLDAARAAGATGATVINNARGEGLHKKNHFLWLVVRSSARCYFIFSGRTPCAPYPRNYRASRRV